MPNSFKQQEKLAKLAGLVSSRYDSGSRAQRSVTSDAEECRLMYRGDQWIQYLYNKWRAAPRSEAWRVRLTINKMIPMVESLIATYLQNKPVITANAGSDEEEDRKSAKVSEKLLRYLWEELEMNDTWAEGLLWSNVPGNAFVRVDWDATKGKKIPIYQTIQMPLNPEDPEAGSQEVEIQTGEQPEGGPVMDVINQFSMTIEPGAEKFDDAAWVIVTEILRRDRVEEMFDLEEPLPKGIESNNMHIPVLVDGNDADMEDRVALHTMYERPTRKHPDGRIAYVVGNKVLLKPDQEDPDPLPMGPNGPEIRIVHIKGIPLPGELYGTSPVSQAIPIQKETNRGRSQLVENRNLCSRPQIISAEGSLLKDALDSRPGRNIVFDPVMAQGYKPEYLRPPSIPQWVLAILSINDSDMNDLFSRHDASLGMAGGVKSAKQANVYKASDDARLGPGVGRFETAMKRVGRYLLTTCKENMKGEQVVAIVGRGREPEVHKFYATDISDQCNITYEVASQMSWSRDANRQQAIYLNSQGKLDDESLMEILRLPSSTKVYEDQQAHRLNAQKENVALEQASFPPMPTDNHQIHILAHSKDINLPERRGELIEQMLAEARMTGQEPQVPQSLSNRLQHLQAHEDMVPPPQPPPPAAKVGLNINKLLENPAVVNNPNIMQYLMPMVLGLVEDSTGKPENPINTAPQGGPGARAPLGESQAGTTTPPGGYSGEVYAAGPRAMAQEEGV